MAKTLDLGRRIELEPTDKHCGGISLGLYRRDADGVSRFLVHTYSAFPDAPGRVAFLRQAMLTLLGMEEAPDAPGWIRFPCKTVHERALRRAFLDLCKLETGAPLEPRPLTAFDKKANGELTTASLGAGVYQLRAEEGSDPGGKRQAALARGFAKLCEMEPVEGAQHQVAFPCKSNHDALMGMMMFRAANVRAAFQEAESAASRGVLSAPSQQAK